MGLSLDASDNKRGIEDEVDIASDYAVAQFPRDRLELEKVTRHTVRALSELPRGAQPAANFGFCK